MSISIEYVKHLESQLHPKCPISREVMERVAQRAEQGMETYGETLEEADLSVLHGIDMAIEEALDLAVYLTAVKRKLNLTINQ